jgi:hypothetical protein
MVSPTALFFTGILSLCQTPAPDPSDVARLRKKEITHNGNRDRRDLA